ncbi:MAG: TolC family protein [Lentisphaeria bacterium]
MDGRGKRRAGGIGLCGLAALAALSGWAGEPAAAAVGSPPPQPYTLEQAVALARARHPLLGAARAGIRVGQGELREAKSLNRPKGTLYGTYGYTNNPVYAFMSKLNQQQFSAADFQLDNLNHPDAIADWQGRAEVVWPLLTGGRQPAREAMADAGLQAARFDAARSEHDIVRAVTEAYYGCLLARAVAGVMEDTVRTARAHTGQVAALNREGVALDSDLLRLKVYQADTEQQRAARRADAESATAWLAYAMGLDQPVATVGDLLPPKPPVAALDACVRAAFDNRQDLRAAAARQRQAEAGIRAVAADFMPQAGLVASYQVDTERWADYGDSWMGGVQVSLPVFDGGRRFGQMESAIGRSEQARLARLDLENRIRAQVKEAWLKSRAAEERLAVTGQAEAQAVENQRLVERQYRESVAGVTDLLDADMALTVARLSRRQATHDLLVERARLQWAVGGG